ncbi:amidohydrolase [Alkalimonas mucilaginosa]|uniref:Amidohydrolase n=1 Tax=Alkalimonas mucilaginosa TaxID=3057676 RepID=A0ABU7JIJ7_9GAMM|nr:amidohydrolase [Alkalimonas sp. MEB004]MEE2025526.1 amidohydrolase [Alkalimonas sp. MEB004]
MPAVKVAAVQCRLHWQDPKANRQQLAGQIAALSGQDLIVLPEMFTTGFSMDSAAVAEPAGGESLNWLKQQAALSGAALCGSVAVTEQGRYYNRLYFVTPEGQYFQYDKKHLFRMAGEHDAYQAGTDRVIVPWRGLRFCLQICYDLRFPVFSRNRNDYDVLIYVANWPAPRRLAWRTLLAARAIENQCYVIGCNRIGSDGNGVEYSGDSLLLDYLGQSLVDGADRAAVLAAELDGAALQQFKDKFPAYLDADGFELTTRR